MLVDGVNYILKSVDDLFRIAVNVQEAYEQLYTVLSRVKVPTKNTKKIEKLTMVDSS